MTWLLLTILSFVVFCGTLGMFVSKSFSQKIRKNVFQNNTQEDKSHVSKLYSFRLVLATFVVFVWILVTYLNTIGWL